MNIYQKMQSAKVQLQELNLKKTGNNKSAGYTYFELTDFLPALNKIMADIGLASCVSFTPETATLTIINSENPEEKLEYTSPMASANLKGAHEIQNLGASQTYERRYLYMAAFDIVESDALDATQNKPDARGETNRRNTQNRTQGKPAPAETIVRHICEECGNEVTAITGKSGNPVSAEKLAAMAMKNYGQVLCAECQAKRKAGN